MRNALKLGCGVALIVLFSTVAAYACHVSGSVVCHRNDGPLAGVRVDFVSTTGDPFSGAALTDADGHFTIALPVTVACYTASPALESPQSPVRPPSGERTICIEDITLDYALDDFVIDDPACELAATDANTWGQLKSTYK